MAIGITDEDYKALVARIAIDDRENLKVTGILYIKNWKKYRTMSGCKITLNLFRK